LLSSMIGGKTCDLSDVDLSDFKPPGGTTNSLFWTTRIKASFGLLPYLDQPDMFVSLASDEFNVTSGQLDRVKMAGVDPYIELGLEEPTVVRGDFNGDGKVTSADALILLQAAVGKITL